MPRLHITNGDSAAKGLQQARLGGDVLPWRDILHEGPVPDSNAEELRRVRATFLGTGNILPFEAVLQSLLDRDTRFAGLEAADQVVLWFEPDLYDQLQLAQILARFALGSPSGRPSISIVPADCLLGDLSPERFAPLLERARPITEDDLQRGTSAWRAITSRTPELIAQFVEQSSSARNYDSDDAVRLPYLASALARWLEELPSLQNGLTRSERQICEVLENGMRTLGYCYQHAHHSVESWIWLGDTTFVQYLQRLSDCREPLILLDNGAVLTASVIQRPPRELFASKARLTQMGRDVVHGVADNVALNGIDRWLGGTHLQESNYWRWDSGGNRVVHVVR